MGHGHSHSHSHVPSPAAGERRLWPLVVGACLIGGFFVVELAAGIAFGSLALIADAGHMLTDVMAMSMALAALLLARKGRATDGRSFGWYRAEVFAAVVNAVLLLGIGAFVLYEAVERFGTAPQAPGLAMVVVAVLGLLINLLVMLLLRVDARSSIAIRGAYLEVLADAVGSVAVLVAGVVTMTTGWGYADIVAAVAIALWVVPRACRLALDALRILNQEAPADVDLDDLRVHLRAVAGVVDVHDLHVWSLTTGMPVASAHLESCGEHDEVLSAARRVFADHGLDHATIQVEPAADSACRDNLAW